MICNSPRNWALDARYSVPIMRFIHYISILNNILNISKFPELWFAILCGSGLLMREALSQLCKNLEQIRFPLFISDSDFYRQHKTRNRQLRDLVLSLQSYWAHFLRLWLCPWSRVVFLGQCLLSNVYVSVILVNGQSHISISWQSSNGVKVWMNGKLGSGWW